MGWTDAPDVTSGWRVWEVADRDARVWAGEVERRKEGDGQSGGDEGLHHGDVLGGVGRSRLEAAVLAAELL